MVILQYDFKFEISCPKINHGPMIYGFIVKETGVPGENHIARNDR
jgi:hypothetical protein